MADIREALESAIEASESGELNVPEEKNIEVVEDTIAEESAKAEASNEDNQEYVQDSTESEHQDQDEKPTKVLPRPSTWKKEYLPIWDKLTTGQELTKSEAIKLAEYSNQRESEYKKGVSAYKAEADYAKGMIEAITPYMPTLKQRNIEPSHYIASLAKADQILSNAPYEQKVQLFQQLASAYGIQLGNNQVQRLDPYTQQLMSQLQTMNQEVSSIKGKFKQEEETRLMSEIDRVRNNVEKFPHFEAVRENMAQLLESGLAQDLETAYAKAVRMNDDVWSVEQERLLTQAQKQSSKAQQVAKAKAAAVSPRSVTPNGVVSSGDKKDRRSLLEEQINSSIGGRV